MTVVGRISVGLFCAWVILLGTYFIHRQINQTSGAPPYGVDDEPPTDETPYSYLRNWKRPEGPARVGLQVGHLNNNELPMELSALIGNTGTSGGGKSEIEVNQSIAEMTATLLQARGITVDILPATVPKQYWADAFVAIHADGNQNSSLSGFKLATPRRDLSGRALALQTAIEKSYQEHTDLPIDPNVSRNMRGYYAFAWWRYDHAVHPMTTALILETGFLTSPYDRNILVSNPQKAANGLAQGILSHLESVSLVPTLQQSL